MKSIIRKDEAAVSPVIATILMVAITVVLAAVLYVMVSGLLVGPGATRPQVTFGSVELSTSPGNATFAVAGVTQSVGPASYKVNLQIGTNAGTAVAMPTTSGASVQVTVGSTVYRIYWTDIGGGNTINEGDQFRVAGNGVPLAPTGFYTFYLLWNDGGQIQTRTWNI
ncbi:MAG TPA: type IV pilin [Thermoplasmata archaeon]|nr:type IV pilin [Thermoplasmata archaeon]